jgi:hypothetical protein
MSNDDDWCPTIVSSSDSEDDVNDDSDLMEFVMEPHRCLNEEECYICNPDLEEYRASSRHLDQAINDLNTLLFSRFDLDNRDDQHMMCFLQDSLDENVRRMCSQDYDEYLKQKETLENEAAMVNKDRDTYDYNDKLYEFDIESYTDAHDALDDPQLRLKRRVTYKTPARWNDGVLKTRKEKKYNPLHSKGENDVKSKMKNFNKKYGVNKVKDPEKIKKVNAKEIQTSVREKQQYKVELETTENNEETDAFMTWLGKTHWEWLKTDDERRRDIQARNRDQDMRVCRFTYSSWGRIRRNWKWVDDDEN